MRMQPVEESLIIILSIIIILMIVVALLFSLIPKIQKYFRLRDLKLRGEDEQYLRFVALHYGFDFAEKERAMMNHIHVKRKKEKEDA